VTAFILLFFCVAVALMLSIWLASEKSPLQVFDTPNERSLHEHPIPGTGGLAIIVSLCIGWGILAWQSGWPGPMGWIAVSALLAAAISFADDLHELPPGIRLLVHAMAAAVLISGGIVLPWGWLGIGLTFLASIWMLNLYNFMDGMDGFAGGMAVAGFGFLGAAGWMAGNETYAWYCWVVATAALGFLWVNFPPARIFMGDAGSATLGLLAAAFSLWGIHDGLFPLWLPILVFSPFILDATVTLIRRGLRREKVWQAHRTHYYQRLVQAGWGHKKTVLVEYALMLGAGSSAIVMLLHPGWWAASLIVWSIIYMLLAAAVDAYCVKQKGGVV
jgi:UDP-N-acetylmuramyl pentapeptide phosphotransferase/UDP-N-acetylglucosamine-1-phosphate transferase